MPCNIASYPPAALLALSLTFAWFTRHEAYAFVPCPTLRQSSAISVLPITSHQHSSTAVLAKKLTNDRDTETNSVLLVKDIPTRRHALQTALSFVAVLGSLPHPASGAKCTDIESCREIGDLKADEKNRQNPTIRLANGVDYKVLRAGTGDERVKEGSKVDIIYSINQSSGRYMYSKGFGYEKTNIGGKMQNDLGLESLRVEVGKHDVPVGIEEALVGMKRGERRRVQVPPRVGFVTSNWKPEPPTQRAKLQIQAYKKILDGFGTQPPFPASTIWDVEVMKIRS